MIRKKELAKNARSFDDPIEIHVRHCKIERLLTYAIVCIYSPLVYCAMAWNVSVTDFWQFDNIGSCQYDYVYCLALHFVWFGALDFIAHILFDDRVFYFPNKCSNCVMWQFSRNFVATAMCELLTFIAWTFTQFPVKFTQSNDCDGSCDNICN